MQIRDLHTGTMFTAVLLAATILAGCAGIQPAPFIYPYYEHMPSANSMDRARHAYEEGRHFRALGHYRQAAEWADKFAQYNVGVMHLRGEGTEFDPVRAWAWIELSAERGYPEFVETADDLYTMLDEAQQREALAVYEQELLPAYGDAAKKPLVARKMNDERRQATGTRTGSDGMLAKLEILETHEGYGITRRGDEFYDAQKWDFRQIVQFESKIMIDYNRGSVEFGELELVDDEVDGENESDEENP